MQTPDAPLPQGFWAQVSRVLQQWAPYLVLVCSLGLTVALWQVTRAASHQRGQSLFDQRSGEIVARVNRRLHDDEQVLRGGLGLFEANGVVTRDEWRRYVAALRMDEVFPGIEGVGFAAWLKPEERDLHVRLVRAEGFPDFDVHPAGERDHYSSVVYIEPFDWRNQRAFGYDMYTDPVRRAAMQRACDTGEAALSDRVILVQETEHETQGGVLMYVPVYHGDSVVHTVEERRAALVGFVFSPIRLGDLIHDTLREMPANIDFTISDPHSESLYHGEARALDRTPQFQSHQSMEVFGQIWNFSFASTPAFEASVNANRETWLLGAGALVSGLMTLLAFLLRSTRQRIERALHESERFADAAFDALTSHVCVLDEHGTILAVNRAWRQFAAANPPCPHNACEGANYWAACTDSTGSVGAEASAFAEGAQAVLRGERDHFVQEYACHSPTEERWFLVRVTRFAGTGPRRLVIAHESITERRQAERALAAEVTRRRVLFEQSPDGIVVIDPVTARFVEFNTAAHCQLGYTRDEFARLSLPDLEGSDVAAGTLRSVAAIARGGRLDFERLLRGGDGAFRTVQVTAQVLDLDGQLIHQCTWRDVTDHKRAEDALREAHLRLKTLGDNLPLGYVYQVEWRPDNSRRFTYLSAGVERVHGVTAAAVLQDPGVLYRLVHDEDRLLLSEQEALACVTLSRLSVDVRIKSPTGGYQWMQLNSEPRRLADGTVQWDGVALDISARKQSEASLLVAGKLEATGIMAGGIAHDFNNLLGCILLSADMARSEDSTPADVAECLQLVRQSAIAAHALTQQLITFAEGGAPVMNPGNIERLVRDALRLTLAGSTVEGRVYAEEGLWPVEVDEGQVAQVFRNLILNAREAMPYGGAVEVRVENARVTEEGGPASLAPGHYVKVTVADEGTGIAAEILPRIFDPYFSTKQRGDKKGMGLGLTICHSVVQKHHGAITVDTELGKGARFQVYLPALPPSPLDGDAAPATGFTVPRLGKVLVMDDEYVLRKMLGRLAERMGCEVEVAADGQEAIERARQAKEMGSPFDLVVLDLTVRGGMGGVEALRHLRQLDPNLKSIVMSGHASSELLHEYTRFGFQEVLQKPFDADRAEQVLTRILKS
ncbi:MAG: CHASE domain-containing protein [Opitutaceae bacterium]|nr:CHASE domain-containing protein [Opitutaceae bacterium]